MGDRDVTIVVAFDRIDLEFALERVLQPRIEFVGAAFLSGPEYPAEGMASTVFAVRIGTFIISALQVAGGQSDSKPD
ncbi:hypothetical protein AU193_20910 [Mycobacterium sp. GA-1285]|uniref:hypothetical protein n=1 Tax=Mycobacterium sp. GA-1285 TaxID=1772282 RepID=UPI0007490D99|nr:hypothetical protein [Mycobacterium sp. GA-1285]KUI22646.1 hypothetical protein AU193_20910 [Mycobacterium sp. GA-1285]